MMDDGWCIRLYSTPSEASVLSLSGLFFVVRALLMFFVCFFRIMQGRVFITPQEAM